MELTKSEIEILRDRVRSQPVKAEAGLSKEATNSAVKEILDSLPFLPSVPSDEVKLVLVTAVELQFYGLKHWLVKENTKRESISLARKVILLTGIPINYKAW